MNSQRIAVVGHYGASADLTDGQTVKVRSLVSALRTYEPDLELRIADTYYLMNGKIILFCWKLLMCLLTCKHIIFFPAARGRQYMFSFFYYLSKIFDIKCYHNCIAGSLDVEILEHKCWVKYLNEFEYNWMESPAQVQKLQTMGIINAEFLPNFKNLTPVILSQDICKTPIGEYRFCIFSRILAMKGIEDALDAIRYLRETRGVDAYLDIYGPVECGEESWFETLTLKYRDFMSYKGIVPYDKSVEVIKEYFALLFPTRFYTEGMPGTILDAMFAGVPVIARKWAWCDNMITNGYNGISYDFEHPELLKEILVQIIDDPQKILKMKVNCVAKSNEYSPKLICQTIVEKIGFKRK